MPAFAAPEVSDPGLAQACALLEQIDETASRARAAGRSHGGERDEAGRAPRKAIGDSAAHGLHWHLRKPLRGTI